MKASALEEEVVALMGADQWKSALSLLTKESSTVRRSWRLSWNLGWCFFKLRRYEEAEEQLKNVVALSPGKAMSHWALANILIKRKDYRAAELSAKRAIRIKDGHMGRITLALAQLAQGKKEQAERTHLRNLRNRPDDPERLRSYAAFLSDVGREQEAKEVLKRARRRR